MKRCRLSAIAPPARRGRLDQISVDLLLHRGQDRRIGVGEHAHDLGVGLEIPDQRILQQGDFGIVERQGSRFRPACGTGVAGREALGGRI